LTKARKGGFKDAELDYIVYALLKETLAQSKIDPALVEDVCLGNVRIPCQSKKFLDEIND
jgi:acetyl-CoA acetyltransferase